MQRLDQERGRYRIQRSNPRGYLKENVRMASLFFKISYGIVKENAVSKDTVMRSESDVIGRPDEKEKTNHIFSAPVVACDSRGFFFAEYDSQLCKRIIRKKDRDCCL